MDWFKLPFKLEFTISMVLLIISSVLIIASCINIIKTKNLLYSVINISVLSLLLSNYYLLMDAPDVAMTEAAINACISTCVFLNLIKIFKNNDENISKGRIILALILVIVFIIILTWASFDLPLFGFKDNPIQTHVSKYYIENTKYDIAIPSFVAAILASYRGYDTLGETVVILIAGLSMLIILSHKKGNKDNV